MIGSPEEVRLAAEDLGAQQICNIYGSTEVYGNCCVTPCDWPLDRPTVELGWLAELRRESALPKPSVWQQTRSIPSSGRKREVTTRGTKGT